MLECEFCDYFDNSDKIVTSLAKCRFTGHIFKQNPETLEMDYPCDDLVYNDYQKRVANSLKVYPHENDDWRFTYQRVHAVVISDRYLKIAI